MDTVPDFQLYNAASLGRYQEVEALLQDPCCDVNFKNPRKDENTPLYIAASWGSPAHIKVIELLLRHGADINLPNCYWQTPLYVAASWGNADVVSLLIKAGANVNLENHERRTPLHIATCPKPHISEVNDISIYYGYDDFGTIILYDVAKMYMAELLPKYSHYLPNLDEDYKLLLKLDVSKLIRIPDDRFKIVLYYNHFAVTVALIEAGAFVNAIDKRRQTPLDKARIWQHGAIMQYLEANRAVEGFNLSEVREN